MDEISEGLLIQTNICHIRIHTLGYVPFLHTFRVKTTHASFERNILEMRHAHTARFTTGMYGALSASLHVPEQQPTLIKDLGMIFVLYCFQHYRLTHTSRRK